MLNPIYSSNKNHLIIQSIIDIVCQHLNIDKKLIYSPSREQNIVKARMYIAYLLKKHFNFSQNQIAHILKKDHSNIHHYLIKTEDEKFLYKDVRETLEKLNIQAEEIKAILA